MKSKFIAALQSEFDHPVRYPGGSILNIDDFASFFTPGFLAAYRAKLQEYGVLSKDRLYCNNTTGITHELCQQFLGNRVAANNAGETALTCHACFTSDLLVSSCVKCSESFSGGINRHMCMEKEEEDRFAELTRGVDYQICPR